MGSEGLLRDSCASGPGDNLTDTAVKSAIALGEWPSLSRMEGSFRRKMSMRGTLTEARVGRHVVRGLKNVTEWGLENREKRNSETRR